MKPTYYKAPSRKALIERLNLTPQQADTVRGLIRGDIRTKDPERFPQSPHWFSACYHEPRRRERILACINEVMTGHGVEPIWGRNPHCPEAEYINTGDTYSNTLLFNGTSFLVTTWGDWFARNAKRLALK